MSLSFTGQSLGTNNINKMFMSVEINSLSTTAPIINTLFSQSSKHNSKLQASSTSKSQCSSSRFLLSLLSPPWLPLLPSLPPRLLLPRFLWLLLWLSLDSVGYDRIKRQYVTDANMIIGSLLFKALRKGADIWSNDSDDNDDDDDSN